MRKTKSAGTIRVARLAAAGLMTAGMLCAALRGTAARQDVCFPLETTVWRVSDGYGLRQDPFTGMQTFHSGIDLACAEGTGIRCVTGGVVTAAGRSAGYGNCLRVQHPDGTETRYAHLQYLYVRAGEVVATGQPLGTAGQTGRATGAHLHFELRRNGAAQDPADLLESCR